MNIIKYKEVIAFCISFSLSFVLMSEVVRNVNPIVSTFVTYGLSAVFFLGVNVKNYNFIWNVLVKNKKSIFKLNVSTLLNTLLAFYVLTYISPISYIIVFFSGLSFFNTIHNQENNHKLALPTNIITVFLAVVVSFLISDSGYYDTCIGLVFTLISTIFGAFYMRESANLHNETGITATQLLSVRFFLVIILCGIFSLFSLIQHGLSIQNLSLLFIISVTGSIIPLFLLQSSIKKLGAKITSQFTSFTPMLCLLFLVLIENQHFSKIEVTIIFVIVILMLCQTLLKNNK